MNWAKNPAYDDARVPLALLDDIASLAVVVRRIAPASQTDAAAKESKSAALRFVTGRRPRERLPASPSRRLVHDPSPTQNRA
jgi:hypothetical protein